MTQPPYRVGVEPTRNIVVSTANEIAGHDIVERLGVLRGVGVRITR